LLAAGEGAKFLNAVALRTAPPRASTGTKPAPAPAATPAANSKPATVAATEDPRSPLEKLADRFKR
jgi:PTH1 family peptidyl-tRNA hydrolase